MSPADWGYYALLLYIWGGIAFGIVTVIQLLWRTRRKP